MEHHEAEVVAACESVGSDALTETVIRDGRLRVRVVAEGQRGLVCRLLSVTGEKVEGIDALLKDLRA